MGVLTNGYRDAIGVFRIYGRTAVNNSYPQGARGNYNRTGMMRNLTAGEGITDQKVGLPMGYVMKGWMLPQKAGMISARVYDITITATAAALRGKALEGSTTFTISTNTPSGELIVSGEGEATLLISTNTPLLTASINGEGSTEFSITTNTPILGAEASLTAATSFSITTNSPTMYPLDDSSPLRTGTATITVTGSLVPYALGHMEGTTEEAGLTNAGIANSVWGKIIEAGFSADQILRIIAAHAAGSATGLEGADPQFTGLDGTTVRIDGSYAAGTRTIDSLNGD